MYFPPKRFEELHFKMRYTPFGGEVKSTGSKGICCKNKIVGNYVIIVLGQENADNLTGRIFYVLGTEYDIQTFPLMMDIKAFWNRARLHLHTQVCFLHNIMLTLKACFIRLAKINLFVIYIKASDMH